MLTHSGQILVAGGVARDLMLAPDEEIIILDFSKSETAQEKTRAFGVHFEGHFPRPLLVGCSIFCSGDILVLMGGGAVCFSFGTFWNTGCFTLSLQALTSIGYATQGNNGCERPTLETWKFLQAIEMVPSGSSTHQAAVASISNGGGKLDLVSIQRTSLSNAVDFSAIVSHAQPVIIEGLDLGSCVETWTSSYLNDQIGRDKKVHSGHMIKV
jgi:tRNA wybutosine-synthesizing protein 4